MYSGHKIPRPPYYSRLGRSATLYSLPTYSGAITVFADIDGVLSNSTSEALASDARTIERLWPSVALVLCSGRTRPEIEHLSQAMGIRHPFICEYGAAVFAPEGCFPFDLPSAVTVAGYDVVEFGRTAGSIVEMLRRVADRQGIAIRAFSEMSVDEVAQECGITPLAARLAKLRDYGEMFRVVDPNAHARARLADALRAMHLRVVSNGPLDHVGASVDVSIGVGLLRTLYRRKHGPTLVVGIADWQSDGDLLQLVECPVAVVGPRGRSMATEWKRVASVETVPFGGSRRWAEAVVDAVRSQYPQVTHS